MRFLIAFALCVLFLSGGTAYAQPREFAQPRASAMRFLIAFALCVLFLSGGTAYAQPREFAQPVFVSYGGAFAAPKFKAAAPCSSCVSCVCQPGVCASGVCPTYLPVSFAPAPTSKFKDCPECVEAENAYQARQAAKSGGVVYAAGLPCASGNCGVSVQSAGFQSYAQPAASYGASCASGNCGTPRTSRPARFFSRR